MLYNINKKIQEKRTHTRIVQPEAVFFPYWTSNTFFLRIVHYVREVTRWFLSSASKLFVIVICNRKKYSFQLYNAGKIMRGHMS
jgi:hypothetical protein